MSEKNKKKETHQKNQLLDDKISYLLRLFENEDKRLTIIENKITHLIGQSGLIISIIAFIIPLFYDKLNNINICTKIGLGLIFILTIILLGLSIYKASEIFKINKFQYADCSPETVNKEFRKIKDFKIEYISDLDYCINKNKGLNNRKGSILIEANHLFIYGIYTLTLLAILLTFTYLFTS
ncbi:hypothetical protein [Snuella lapsa]|uniref:Uncharacterized protein n=1 Tax=Snuella lapsa TaxID=870481 RepID=A0ABP6XN56_9FLAO